MHQIRRQATTPLAAFLKPPPKRRRNLDRRREQCRASQARYRAKLQSAHLALMATVAQLHIDVLQLHERRALLFRPVEAFEAACRTTHALFEVFRCGLAVDERCPDQLALLAAVYHDDVCMGDHRGRAAVVMQWYRFSTWWKQLAIELRSIECVVASEQRVRLRVSLRVALTITPETIARVFPHLLTPSFVELQHQLVDQRLVCGATAFYEFDASGRIAEADWTIDFVRALSVFLSIYDVARALNDAQIERNAFLIERTLANGRVGGLF